MLTTRQNKGIGSYIGQIRNVSKRAYAVSYFKWLQTGQQYTEPKRPLSLAVAAAQAIRVEVGEIVS